MVQHPIPRQITTFEFKLIGFMTLKQFLYLVVFLPLAFIAYKLFPIPYLNYLVGAAVASVGAALAFIPINDRPFDVWIKNLIKRLTSPTQFVYHKESRPLYFLEDLFFLRDPHIITTHIESKEKLNAYLTKTQTNNSLNKRKAVNNLLNKPQTLNVAKVEPASVPIVKNATQIINLDSPKKPFLLGVVKNNKKTPLSGVLIYIKDQSGTNLRLLKTNLHGVFATFKPVVPGDYLFEIKDPKGRHFFDTMKIKVEENNGKPFEFYSKEII